MTEKTSNQSLVDNLVALKAQYESELTEAGSKATYYKDQLVHLNALLLDRLLPSQEFRVVQPQLEKPEPVLVVTTQDESPNDRPSLPPASKALSTAKADSQAPASRVSLPFLPKYQGKKKLEAIGEVMQSHVGEVLHQDTIIQLLFGDLSPAALKTERLRMKTALLQGVKKGFWSKAPKPSSYILKGSKAKLEQTAASTAKLKAAPKAETAKKKATPAKSASPMRQGRAPKAARPAAKAEKSVAKRAPARGRQAAKANQAPGQSPRIILPMHSEFTGLSKIEAVEKVMAEYAGKPVHIDTIIDRLFGTLSSAEAKAEKGRMKDVMNRGRDRKLWNKAPAPLSFVMAASSAGTTTKPSTAKPATKAGRRRKGS